MHSVWMNVALCVVATSLGIYGIARVVPTLAEMLYIKFLELQVRRLLPVSLGIYVYVPDLAHVVKRVISRLERFGISVVPIHQEAAIILLTEYYWYNDIARGEFGTPLDLVMVGDLRSWWPMNGGGGSRFKFTLRAYNTKGRELLHVHPFNNEVSRRAGASNALVRLGYKRALQAILALQKHKNTDPRWAYDTSEWPFKSHAFERIGAEEM